VKKMAFTYADRTQGGSREGLQTLQPSFGRARHSLRHAKRQLRGLQEGREGFGELDPLAHIHIHAYPHALLIFCFLIFLPNKSSITIPTIPTLPINDKYKNKKSKMLFRVDQKQNKIFSGQGG